MSIPGIILAASILGALTEYARSQSTRNRIHNAAHAITHRNARRRTQRTFNC